MANIPVMRREATLFAKPLSNNQIVLVDMTWSLPALPIETVSQIYAFRAAGHDFAISADVLLSTPSDFRTLLIASSIRPATKISLAETRQTIQSALRRLGLLPTPIFRTIHDYLRSGRFNSAAHHPQGIYSFDTSLSLLHISVEFAFTRIIDLILIEMSREFFFPEPTPLAYEQIYSMSLVNDDKVWAWLVQWTLIVWAAPAGQRAANKRMVEKALKAPTVMESLLAEWFEKNPAAGREGDMGELARSRELVRIGRDVT